MANLGPCCVCESTVGVTSMVMLPVKGMMPGHGWGCVVCGLRANGAVAVLCGECIRKQPVYACRGYPGTDGRIPVADLRTPQMHDASKHLELSGQRVVHPGGEPLGDAEFVRAATMRFLDQRISRVEETMRRYETHITALEDRCGRLEQAASLKPGIAPAAAARAYFDLPFPEPKTQAPE